MKLPNCCCISLRVFVLEADLPDLDEGNHDLLGGMSAVHLQMEIIGGNAGDPLADSTRRAMT